MPEPPLAVDAALPLGARVVFVRLSALGDVLFSLETVASLAAQRPDVIIDFLVEDRFKGLIEGHPQIHDVLVYPRRNKLRIPRHFWRLRQRRYAVVFDLHGNLKSAIQVWFCRSRMKVGYDKPIAREGAQRAYHRKVTLSPRPHRAEQGLHLLEAIGLEAKRVAPVLPSQRLIAPGFDLAQRALARDLPKDVPSFPWTKGGGQRVLLHPGVSAFALFKRWPPERYGELAARLTSRSGLEVAISAGPGEHALAREVQRLAPQAKLVDGQKIGLPGFVGVLEDADLVVAGDTGPLHMAAASGTQVVALFGPKDPALYGPRDVPCMEGKHQVHFHDVPCRPCTRRSCAAPLCVRGVTVDEVEASVLRALGRDSRSNISPTNQTPPTTKPSTGQSSGTSSGGSEPSDTAESSSTEGNDDGRPTTRLDLPQQEAPPHSPEASERPSASGFRRLRPDLRSHTEPRRFTRRDNARLQPQDEPHPDTDATNNA